MTLVGSSAAARAGPGLLVDNVTKIYPEGKAANDGISLRIEPGEVFGLLGPNGAGRTTLVHQIIGLLRPSQGRISLGGLDLVRPPDLARRVCSYLPQGPLPIDGVKAGRAVELMGRLRGGRPGRVRARVRALLRELEIEAWGTQVGSRLSGGVRRLVGFAMAAVVPGTSSFWTSPPTTSIPSAGVFSGAPSASSPPRAPGFSS